MEPKDFLKITTKTFNIPEVTLNRLDQLAKTRGSNPSQILNQLVFDFIQQSENPFFKNEHTETVVNRKPFAVSVKNDGQPGY